MNKISLFIALGMLLFACGPKKVEDKASTIQREAFFKNIQFNVKGYLTQGFNPLAESIVKKTDCFRFTYDSKDRVVKVEFIIKNMLEDAMQYGFAKREFYYTDSSFYYINYDRNGKKLPFGRNSGADGVFAKEIILKNGIPEKEQGLDFNNKPVFNGFVKLYECDTLGRIIWERHEDNFGKVLDFTANDGIFYRKYEYNNANLVTANSFWESKTVPKSLGAMHKIVYEYNKDGNIVMNAFQDVNEKLIKEPSTGIAYRKMSYNQLGNMLEQVMFNERNEVINGQGGFAYQINEFDKNSNNTLTKYLAADKAPVVVNKIGAHAERITYDDRGDLVLSEFLDTKNKLMVSQTLKYAYKAMEYDELGRVISESFFDNKNKAIIYEGLGAHAKLSEYDKKGLLAASSFLNTDAQLFAHPACNCSRIEFTHDSLGNLISEKYFKINGKLAAAGQKNVAERKYSYDTYGEMIMVQYYDTLGKEITAQGNKYLQ